ncbi:TetR/AcrR family transcriptional regulator [Emcibacter sp.]|uniref:TetR/AcrR family transcriptional regulator n=1 Tax=Emcibacter sp. TaxID=1979954 RepID=UPI002AA8FB68|nr:TetR/AcrR family transcriptional regulator [Emcibacter sp.]
MKREEKRQQKLDAILRHAAKAFMEKGYYKTSLDDIAKMHNVTKPTLYYYIKNKEDILVKCEDVASEKINGLLDKVMDMGGTGYQQLYAFIRDYIKLLNDDIIRCHVRHRGQREEEAARDASLKMHRGIESRVRAIIARGVEDGSIRKDAHPVINAILLFDALNGITAWYREDGALDMKALTEQILTLVAKGIEA